MLFYPNLILCCVEWGVVIMDYLIIEHGGNWFLPVISIRLDRFRWNFVQKSLKSWRVSWKSAWWQPYVTCGRKWIYINTFHIFCPIWIQFGIRDLLHAVLFSIYEFQEIRNTESTVKPYRNMKAKNVLVLCYVTTVRHLYSRFQCPKVFYWSLWLSFFTSIKTVLTKCYFMYHAWRWEICTKF